MLKTPMSRVLGQQRPERTHAGCTMEAMEDRLLMASDYLYTDGTTDPAATGSAHTGGIVVALGDGSVRQHDGGSQTQLEGQQCLVFYLGGTR